jgi:hypothetical protein
MGQQASKSTATTSTEPHGQLSEKAALKRVMQIAQTTDRLALSSSTTEAGLTPNKLDTWHSDFEKVSSLINPPRLGTITETVGEPYRTLPSFSPKSSLAMQTLPPR